VRNARNDIHGCAFRDRAGTLVDARVRMNAGCREAGDVAEARPVRARAIMQGPTAWKVPLTMTEPLWQWPAHRLADSIRQGAVSARDAVVSCIERVHAVNPKLNAIVDALDDEALAAADAADAARRRGERLAPLHGVPVTVKVNVDCAGRATTNGVVAFKDNIAAEDSPVVANLRRAGAIVIGRTNTPAFSVRWFTENDLHGRTLNPWSQAHTPGGSSGGASSAVAAGMGAIAHGNDLAGSVRYPAYCTGVVGLRPSFGRVPAYIAGTGVERPLSIQMMSVQGPLARCVHDVRLALAAMSAGDARDPWWVPAPLQGPAWPRPLRVAMTVNCGGKAADASVVAALRQAAQWLADAGYVVEEVEPPGLAAAAEQWEAIANDECRMFMMDAVERLGDAGVKKAFGAMIADSPVLDHAAHLQAFARRTTLIREWQRFFERYPLVLTPVSGEPAFPYGLDVESDAAMRRIRSAQETQFAVPLLGLPAISVPTGMAGAVPMGVQLIGPRFREDLLLDAAEVIEGRCPPFTPLDPRF
jgi:amidase